MQLQEVCNVYKKKNYYKSFFFVFSMLWIFGIVGFGAANMYLSIMRKDGSTYTNIFKSIFEYQYTPEILVAVFILSFYLMFIKIPRKIRLSESVLKIGSKDLPLHGLTFEFARWYSQHVGITGTIIHFVSNNRRVSIAAPELMFSEQAYNLPDTDKYDYYVKEPEQLEYLLSYLRGFTAEAKLPDSAESDLASGRPLRLNLAPSSSKKSATTFIALLIFFGGFTLFSILGTYVFSFIMSQELFAFYMAGGIILNMVILFAFIFLSPKLIAKRQLYIERESMRIERGKPFPKSYSAPLNNLKFELCTWRANVQGTSYYVGPALRITGFEKKPFTIGTSMPSVEVAYPDDEISKTDYLLGAPQFKLFLQRFGLHNRLRDS